MGVAQSVFVCCSQLGLRLASCEAPSPLFLRSCRAEPLPVASPGGLHFLRKQWLDSNSKCDKRDQGKRFLVIVQVWRSHRSLLTPFTSLVMIVSKAHPGPWRNTEPHLNARSYHATLPKDEIHHGSQETPFTTEHRKKSKSSSAWHVALLPPPSHQAEEGKWGIISLGGQEICVLSDNCGNGSHGIDFIVVQKL